MLALASFAPSQKISRAGWGKSVDSVMLSGAKHLLFLKETSKSRSSASLRMTGSEVLSRGLGEQGDWPVYGGGPENAHYSGLAQINRSNVRQLRVAWRFDTGETGGLQTNPIVVEGALYAYTPSQKVIALDATTGQLRWKFDSGVRGWQPARGLAYWADGKDKRILAGVMNLVYALDAHTGTPISAFGHSGHIDLREDLGREPESQSVSLTSPGIVYKDLLIVGGREPETLPAPPGDIRAYDVRTGRLRWSFHTIPHPGEAGYDTWPKDAWKYSGAANNWAGMAVDIKRGIVYVPTGSAASDFYGADRAGDNLFANCLLALNAGTGERIWHFQAVKHDLWDRDFPSPPSLVTLERGGNKIDAVAQTSKQGFVFLFDRTNGRPLFPIEYHRYAPSDVPGEVTATEQPLPTKPAPFARQLLTEDLLTNRTPEAHQWALEQFRKFRSQGQFVPFSVGKDTVVFPGFDGGAEWGGTAVDPETGILYVNANDIAWTGALAENSGDGKSTARGLYLSQCSVCHRDNLAGSPPDFPPLRGIANRRSPEEIGIVIRNGKGRMPGFSGLSEDQLFALIEYLMSGSNNELESSETIPKTKYRFTGYHKFLDPEGFPAVAPPWGTLNAIDLNTGEYVWKIPLGEYGEAIPSDRPEPPKPSVGSHPERTVKGVELTGTENYGGPIVTAGGLVFIGATNFDKKFRAFDKSTGEPLWEVMLPFAGNATPATYEVNGRQYLVIAAGGGKAADAPSGGVYVAFALPQ
jgi:quinoprotein glucose dehydrogenase